MQEKLFCLTLFSAAITIRTPQSKKAVLRITPQDLTIN